MWLVVHVTLPVIFVAVLVEVRVNVVVTGNEPVRLHGCVSVIFKLFYICVCIQVCIQVCIHVYKHVLHVAK